MDTVFAMLAVPAMALVVIHMGINHMDWFWGE